MAPPLDFGDRYSANRTRDRERRQQFQQGGDRRGGGHMRNNGEQYQGRYNNHHDHRGGGHQDRGDRGGGYERQDFNRPPPRFHHQQGGGPPPRDWQERDVPQGTPPQGGQGDASKELPPRFKKMSFNTPPPPLQQGGPPPGGPYHQGHPPPQGQPAPGGSPPPQGQQMNMLPPQGGMAAALGKDVEVALRPQSTSNMLFKPKTPSMLPKSAISRNTDGPSPLGENSLLGPPLPPMHQKIMQQKEAQFLIKQAADGKGRKEKNKPKGPTREEVFNRVETILNELLEHQSTNEAAESWKENDWLPSKMTQTAVSHFYKVMLEKNESERELACQFLLQLVSNNSINNTHCYEALSKTLQDLEKEDSKSATNGTENAGGQLKSNLADTAAWSVTEKICSLAELSELTQGGACHPAFLQTLQRLLKQDGRDSLVELFEASGVRLMDQVPEPDRNEGRLVEILEDYQLTFLMPLLSIRQDMVKQLSADPSPASFTKWIGENVDAGFHGQAGFIMALFDVVFKHIVESTTLPAGADPAATPDKALIEAEKEMLSKYRTVLQPFVQDKADLQLTGVYALQVFCHGKSFPKGMLLRAFVNFYEMDIMDEHAFLQWKEDVNDSYPGKGKALFQVNQWLTWLEEAESEDEDDEDDE